MDQIHLSPLVDQIQLALGHISNSNLSESEGLRPEVSSMERWRPEDGETADDGNPFRSSPAVLCQ
jgi:hypothetical protein